MIKAADENASAKVALFHKVNLMLFFWFGCIQYKEN